MRIWDIPSGEELNRYTEHTGWILEAVLSPDELFLVTASEDLTLRRWNVAPNADDLIDWARENRHIRELTCAERQSYRLACDS